MSDEEKYRNATVQYVKYIFSIYSDIIINCLHQNKNEPMLAIYI